MDGRCRLGDLYWLHRLELSWPAGRRALLPGPADPRICSATTGATTLLDLAGVTGLDTDEVGILVVAYRVCAQLGVRLRVCNPSPWVVELLTAAGVAERLIG